ncbi:MAG TPA: imidazolonepropionase [Candidatus Dormibacteraeota bacterium]
MLEADLVVHNIGQLVTCEPSQGEGILGTLEHATVAALRGEIVWVGPDGRWPWRVEPAPGAAVIDAQGACVVPGFVDAHCQVLWNGKRADEHAARMRGQPFWGGGIMRTVRLTQNADEDRLVDLGRERLRAFLRNGITALEVKTGYGLNVEAEEKLVRAAARLVPESPQRLVTTFLGAQVVPDGMPPAEYVSIVVDEMLPRLRGQAAFCDAWCDPGAFDPLDVRRILRKALGLGYQLKLQASQLAPGDGPRLAVELGVTSVAHLNYLREGDARALADSPVVCVVCPGPTVGLKLAAEGSARALAGAGCELAVATGYNPGTSTSENMCLMIGLACSEMGLTPEEALRAATLGGARALRLQRQCGSVRLAKRCDLLILDAETYLEIPYRLGVNIVDKVICQGRLAD